MENSMINVSITQKRLEKIQTPKAEFMLENGADIRRSRKHGHKFHTVLLENWSFISVCQKSPLFLRYCSEENGEIGVGPQEIALFGRAALIFGFSGAEDVGRKGKCLSGRRSASGCGRHRQIGPCCLPPSYHSSKGKTFGKRLAGMGKTSANDELLQNKFRQFNFSSCASLCIGFSICGLSRKRNRNVSGPSKFMEKYLQKNSRIGTYRYLLFQFSESDVQSQKNKTLNRRQCHLFAMIKFKNPEERHFDFTHRSEYFKYAIKSDLEINLRGYLPLAICHFHKPSEEAFEGKSGVTKQLLQSCAHEKLENFQRKLVKAVFFSCRSPAPNPNTCSFKRFFFFQVFKFVETLLPFKIPEMLIRYISGKRCVLKSSIS